MKFSLIIRGKDKALKRTEFIGSDLKQAENYLAKKGFEIIQVENQTEEEIRVDSSPQQRIEEAPLVTNNSVIGTRPKNKYLNFYISFAATILLAPIGMYVINDASPTTAPVEINDHRISLVSQSDVPAYFFHTNQFGRVDYQPIEDKSILRMIEENNAKKLPGRVLMTFPTLNSFNRTIEINGEKVAAEVATKEYLIQLLIREEGRFAAVNESIKKSAKKQNENQLKLGFMLLLFPVGYLIYSVNEIRNGSKTRPPKSV